MKKIYRLGTFALLLSFFSHATDYAKDLQEILAVSEQFVQEELQKEHNLSGGDSLIEDFDEQRGVLVFISSSVPLQTWKAFSYELEKINGSFVLRGMPNNSLKEFIQFVQQLKNAGVKASIKVDAPSFEKYQISAVPSIVLDDGKQFDKVIGNIPIRNALEIFSSKGELRTEAKKNLHLLDHSWDMGLL